jgi:hypothetical protein
VKLTARDRAVYNAYLADPKPPFIEEEIHSHVTAWWLDTLFPGIGFFNMGQFGKGILWSTLGLPTWPLFWISASAASKSAKNLNIKYIAEQYVLLRPDWDTPQQQQQQQQQQTTVVVIGKDGSVQTGGAPQQAPPTTTSCTACGSQNPRGSRFCNGCGDVVDQDAGGVPRGGDLRPGMRACEACDVQNPAASRFCSSCGGKLEPPGTPTQRFCGSCGTKLNAGASFCSGCGARH